jgi:hypothetical protein
MKKLIFLLVLCLVASSAHASFQLFRDNYNVNQIADASISQSQASPNWRRMAPGEPLYIPSQTDAYRQGGANLWVTYSESYAPWYSVQCGSSDGDLPPELEPPNRGTKSGSGYFPGTPGESAENAVQFYGATGGQDSVSPDVAVHSADLSVNLDVHVPYSTATGTACWGWVGVGAQNTMAHNGGTGVLLAPDNQWYVFNAGNVLANGVGNFASVLDGSSTDLQMVPVALDLIGGDLTVVVNGTAVVTDEALVSPLGSWTYVTFGIYGTMDGGETTMNKFFFADDLDVWGIPEPATIALLGLGGLALLRRRS